MRGDERFQGEGAVSPPHCTAGSTGLENTRIIALSASSDERARTRANCLVRPFPNRRMTTTFAHGRGALSAFVHELKCAEVHLGRDRVLALQPLPELIGGDL